MRAIALSIMTLALVGCSKGKNEPPSDGAYIVAGKEYVRQTLKDAKSAEFQNVSVSRSAGMPVICGEVNAKNSFGGYNGYRRFISGGPGPATQIEGEGMEASEFAKTWDTVC